MYGLIWLSLLQILFVFYTPFGEGVLTEGVHALLGLVVLALAFTISRRVKATACPGRIKRITKTTLNLSLFQGLLGIFLVAVLALDLGSMVLDAAKLIHAATALAIITQASSSATAYDMWEEKEFLEVPAAPAQSA
jgi:hypothetical protein